MGRIVIGIDGSTGSSHALRWAAREAELRQWGIEPVMAFTYTPAPVLLPSAARAAPSLEDVERYTWEALTRAVGPILGDRARKQQTVALGRPADVILDAGESADLIVVGSRGLGGFTGLLLGSVSREIVTRAHVPVAVIPEGAAIDPTANRVVVGVDDSEPAADALRWADAAARVRGAELQVVHVASSAPLIAPPGAPMPVIADDELAKSARHTAERVLDAVLGPEPENVSVHGRVGHPAEQLLQAADEADLLVVGSRGRGRAVATLLGSTSGGCVTHTAGATVVVPPSRPVRDDEAAVQLT